MTLADVIHLKDWRWNDIAIIKDIKPCFSCFVLLLIVGLHLHSPLFVTNFVVLAVTTWRSGDLHAHLRGGCCLPCSRLAPSRISLLLVAVLGADVFDGTWRGRGCKSQVSAVEQTKAAKYSGSLPFGLWRLPVEIESFYFIWPFFGENFIN